MNYRLVGRPAERAGTIDAPIGRDPSNRLRQRVASIGRPALTRVQLLERFRAHSLVTAELATGRTHQIRVHLSALGHPVAGDAEYGGRRPGEPQRPMLHAWRLRLRHPRTRAEMSFEAPPPLDFEAFWASLA